MCVCACVSLCICGCHCRLLVMSFTGCYVMLKMFLRRNLLLLKLRTLLTGEDYTALFNVLLFCYIVVSTVQCTHIVLMHSVCAIADQTWSAVHNDTGPELMQHLLQHFSLVARLSVSVMQIALTNCTTTSRLFWCHLHKQISETQLQEGHWCRGWRVLVR